MISGSALNLVDKKTNNPKIARNCNKRAIAVMCNYKFDMEHGIAIVYENEEFKEVGPQDIAL